MHRLRLVLPALVCLTAASAGAREPARKEDAAWALLQKPPARLTVPKKAARAAPCQPATLSVEDLPTGDTTAPWGTRGTYSLPGGQEVSLDDWKHEEGRQVTLPAPYALTQYTFHCFGGGGNQVSDALAISRGGKHDSLLAHVLDFQTHPTRPVLLLDQNEPLPKGRYQRFLGLVDLSTQTHHPLPTLPCVAGMRGRFHGDTLLTHGEPSPQDARTDVCVWGLDGQLRGWLRAKLAWTEGRDAHPREQVGVLPHEPDTFYALDHEPESGRCLLRLHSLTRPEGTGERTLGPFGTREECLAQEGRLGAFRLGRR